MEKVHLKCWYLFGISRSTQYYNWEDQHWYFHLFENLRFHILYISVTYCWQSQWGIREKNCCFKYWMMSVMLRPTFRIWEVCPLYTIIFEWQWGLKETANLFHTIYEDSLCCSCASDQMFFFKGSIVLIHSVRWILEQSAESRQIACTSHIVRFDIYCIDEMDALPFF